MIGQNAHGEPESNDSARKLQNKLELIEDKTYYA